MQTIEIYKINIPEKRQRSNTSPQKLQELKNSILQEGLLHALILTEGNTLVAGRTRLAAISEIISGNGKFFYDGKEVPPGEVPYTFTHKTDPASLFKIELEENLRREALSPIDEAMALAALHRLQIESAPVVFPGTAIKEQVTFQDTAKVLGEITGQPLTTDAQRISDSILVDKFKDVPEVKNAKTFSEAVRLAKKNAERTFREVMGRMGLEQQDTRHVIALGDCKDLLPGVKDGVVDVILMDPPYGIGADEHGEQSKIGHEYKDDEEAFRSVMGSIEEHASRVCKPDAAMFIFLDINMFLSVLKYTPDFLTGWYIWPTPLIWHKPNRGHAPQPKRGPSRRYEAILYAVRGNREVRKVGTDVLTFAVPDNRAHAAGKPPDLYEELLSWVCYPGDVVLDPCAGGGTVIEAADRLDLSAIAFERDPAYFTLLQDRIQGKEAD